MPTRAGAALSVAGAMSGAAAVVAVCTLLWWTLGRQSHPPSLAPAPATVAHTSAAVQEDGRVSTVRAAAAALASACSITRACSLAGLPLAHLQLQHDSGGLQLQPETAVRPLLHPGWRFVMSEAVAHHRHGCTAAALGHLWFVNGFHGNRSTTVVSVFQVWAGVPGLAPCAWRGASAATCCLGVGLA